MIQKILAYFLIIPTFLIFYPTWRLFNYYSKLLLSYVFGVDVFLRNRKVEKPRLFFFAVGVIVSVIAWGIFFYTSLDNVSFIGKNTINILTIAILLLATCFNAVGIFLMFFVWTKKFESDIIPLIKQRIVLGIKSPFLGNYDYEAILNELARTFTAPNTKSFQSFLSLKELLVGEKLVWSGLNRELLRFIIVVLGLNPDRNDLERQIRKIISYYFVGRNDKSIVFKSLKTDISKIRGEITNDSPLFIQVDTEIKDVFRKHEIGKR